MVVLLLLLLPLTNEAIEKVFAASTMLPSTTKATTPINSIDAETKNNSPVVAQTPFYQAVWEADRSNRTEYWRSSSDTRVYHRKWNYEWCWYCYKPRNMG